MDQTTRYTPQRNSETDELVALLKNKEYPRSLIQNDEPATLDAEQFSERFNKNIREKDRYSFLSK